MASPRPSNGGNTLLSLGKEVVVSLREAAPDALELLERYVTAFGAWEVSWREVAKGGRIMSAREREVGRRVAAQHAQILRLADEMRKGIDESLKVLRVKGKGLKAYIDPLPHRLSTIKTRKG